MDAGTKAAFDVITKMLKTLGEKVDASTAKLTELEAVQTGMAQSFVGVAQTLELHTEMLSTILQAATEEQPPSDIAEGMRAIAGAMEASTEEVVEAINNLAAEVQSNTRQVMALTGNIEGSVRRGVAPVLAIVTGQRDDDGIVEEDK